MTGSTSNTTPSPTPAALDLTVPDIARMYDYWLGGKDNYQADREAADRVAANDPWIPDIAKANRNFMAAAVQAAAHAGVTQFVDIGTGIPTEPSAFTSAWKERPDALVIGVDNNPVVLSHGRALASSGQNAVRIVEGDARDPAQILASLDDWVNWDAPVALVLVAVLHFIRDQEDPHKVVATFRERMAPGSRLILTHVSSDGTPAEIRSKIEAEYANASAPLIFRTESDIAHLFDGFQLLDAGLTSVLNWLPDKNKKTDDGEPDLPKVHVAAGIGELA